MLFADLMDLVLPAACAGCAEPSRTALCGPAARRSTAPAGPHQTGSRSRPGLPPTYALAAYAGSLRRVILQYKEEHRHELTTGARRAPREGRDATARRVDAAGVLVPVPATAAAARRTPRRPHPDGSP